MLSSSGPKTFLTVEGRHLHEKAHDGKAESRGDVRIARSLWLKSNQIGLIGQADIVEFHRDGTIIPVEYKRGKPKKDNSDRVQLCAQAICLEHMLDARIDSGQLFYGTRKRRTDVHFDENLRRLTRSTVDRFRELIDSGETPTALRQPKCDKCSLVELCLPNSQRLRRGVDSWNNRQYDSANTMVSPDSDSFSIFDGSDFAK